MISAMHIDVFLGVMNAFNIFVLLTHLTPIESPMKKGAVLTLHKVVKPLHTVQFLTSAVLAVCVVVAVMAASNALETDDTKVLVRAIVAAYTFACTSVFVKLSDTMIKLGIDRVLEIEREVEQQDIINFKPPSLAVCDALMAPMKPFLKVDSTGLDRIPKDTPHLFVMNHSLLGVEMPFLLHNLYREKGIFVRGLADRFHFATPNGPVIKQFGAVNGNRANVDCLMKSKQDVLVYPGGSHEVLKHSSVPRYELLWKERLGFARLAIKHKYPILPCAAVGTEDMLEIVMDVPVEFVRKGMSLPIATTSPSKIQKIYFWFGDPISTEQYGGEYQNDAFAREVRDKAKAAIEAGIKELQEKQKKDPDRYLIDQYTRELKRAFSSAYESFCETLGASAPADDETSNDFAETSDADSSKQKSS